MPFLGNQPSTGYSTIVKDDFTANGNDTVFTLSQAAASATSIAVFVGNVRQEPTDAYTVNGTTLTMSAAPANGANFYVLHISGAVENSSVPASGTVGTSQLANSAVTTAKIADDQITSAKLANAINITSGNSLTIDSGATITNNGAATGFGKVLQYVISTYTTQTSTSLVIPNDGSIPQNTEGVEILTATITPTSASNKLLIEFDAPFLGGDRPMGHALALFQDSGADAIVASTVTIGNTTWSDSCHLRHYMTSGTTSATTFKVRWGVINGVGYINRWDTGSIFGAGATQAILKITELSV